MAGLRRGSGLGQSSADSEGYTASDGMGLGGGDLPGTESVLHG